MKTKQPKLVVEYEGLNLKNIVYDVLSRGGKRFASTHYPHTIWNLKRAMKKLNRDKKKGV